MKDPAPGSARARAALRWLAGLGDPGRVSAGEPLPTTTDLWPLCLAHHEADPAGAPLAPGAAARARECRLAVSAGSLARLSLGREIRDRLGSAGIPALPIKGLALLPRYPSPGLRPAEDIDLLVPDGSLEAACGLLESDGFRLHPLGFRSPASVPLVTQRGMGVDLATRLFNPRIPLWRELVREDPGVWWSETRDGALSREAEVVLVGAHAAKHWFVRDRWIADLALVLGGGPDLGRASQLAARLGMGPLLRLALSVASRVIGLRIPWGLGLAPGEWAEGEALVARLVEGRHDYRDRRLARFLPLLPGTSARLRVLAAVLMPPAGELAERYRAPGLLGLWARRLGLVGDPDAGRAGT